MPRFLLGVVLLIVLPRLGGLQAQDTLTRTFPPTAPGQPPSHRLQRSLLSLTDAYWRALARHDTAAASRLTTSTRARTRQENLGTVDVGHYWAGHTSPTATYGETADTVTLRLHLRAGSKPPTCLSSGDGMPLELTYLKTRAGWKLERIRLDDAACM